MRDLDAEERSRLLHELCADDDDLRRAVEALLEEQDATTSDATTPDSLDTLEVRDARNGAINHYQLLGQLGSGGMGIVYEALDTRLDRRVALKFMHSSPGRISREAERRFLLEAQAAAALDHPNICTVHEVGESDDGRPYIAMPLYDGSTLAQRLDSDPMDPHEVVSLIVQACRGLERAHEHGVVHRDIKPANLFVTKDGLVKILDFGVAKLADVSITRSGALMGTVAYMSPEQVSGRPVDHRTDLWSLGVVLYEALTGRRPFVGDEPRSILAGILNDEPTPVGELRRDLPRSLEGVVSRALAKDPENRHHGAGELADDLASCMGTAVDADAASAPSRTRELPAAAARLLPEGERRQATVVLSRLEGYSELLERFGPRDVDQIMSELETSARALIESEGGILNRFTGEEFTIVFGIPTTHEDDGVRAARTALRLQRAVQSVESSVTSAVPRLDLRSGLASGLLVAHTDPSDSQQYRLVGNCMTWASRLADEAAAGELLVPESHRHVLPWFETRAADEIDLPKLGRVTAHVVLRDRDPDGDAEASRTPRLSTHTGRDSELRRLTECRDLARGGEGRLALVVGEPGVGKSRLLHEFDRTVDETNTVVLRGRCQSYGSNVSYLPFLGMLRSVLGLGEEQPSDRSLEQAVDRLRRIDPVLEEVFPILLHVLSIQSSSYPVPQQLRRDQSRFAIIHALATLFTCHARSRSTLILLEDWHWVDEASSEVLVQLAEMVSGYPLLIVCTMRPGYGVAVEGFGEPTRIELSPLDRTTSRDMVCSILGTDELPDHLAETLYDRTSGNPFFLEEICQALREDGTLHVEHGHVEIRGSVDGLELPGTVQGVIRSRLDRIDPQAREVLGFASVIGREFGEPILAKTLGDQDPGPALSLLRRLGLVQQVQILPFPLYRFKHALTQEVTYESLLQHQRRDLHGRVAQAIESVHADAIEEHLDRLAMHFARAERLDQAVEYGMRSAQRAIELCEFPEALGILEKTGRWLRELPEGPERKEQMIQLLLREERMCEAVGLRHRQLSLIEELRRLLADQPDRLELAEVHLRLGDVHMLVRDFDAAETALEHSLEIAQRASDDEHQRRTLRSVALLRRHQGRRDEAIRIIEQLLESDRTEGNDEEVLSDINNLVTVLYEPGPDETEEGRSWRLRRCRELLATGLALADELESAQKKSYLMHRLAMVQRGQGDTEAATETLVAAIEHSEAAQVPLQQGFHLTALAHLHLQSGRQDDALRAYDRAIRVLRRAGHAELLSQALRTQGQLLLSLNRHDDARILLEEAADLFQKLEDGEAEAQVWETIASLHDAQARYAEAMAAWSRARDLHVARGDRAKQLKVIEEMGRSTHRSFPEPSLAMQYFRDGLTLAEALGDAEIEGRIRNSMGIIEWKGQRYEAALEHYRRALEIFEARGHEAEVGHLLNSIGVTLHRMSRTEEAATVLASARTRNERAGNRMLLAYSLASLGELYLEQERHEEAVEHFDASLTIRRELRDSPGEAWMLHGLARAHAASGSLDHSRDCVTEARRIAENLKDEDLIRACLRLRT